MGGSLGQRCATRRGASRRCARCRNHAYRAAGPIAAAQAAPPSAHQGREARDCGAAGNGRRPIRRGARSARSGRGARGRRFGARKGRARRVAGSAPHRGAATGSGMAGPRGRSRCGARPLESRNRCPFRLAAYALADPRRMDSACRAPRVARPDARRLRAGPRMARGATGLLGLLLFGASAASAQLRIVEVPVAGRASLDSLTRLGFEVADVRLIDGTQRAVIVVSSETESQLAQHGFRVAALTVARVPTGAAAATFRMFPSFDNPGDGIRATLFAWAAAHTLIHLDSVGASYDGRPILAVKIGPPDDSPSRANVLFMGTHHAREWITTAVAMKLIRWLADSGATLSAGHAVWVIPVENPDGYQYTFTTDRYWRKNRRPNANGSYGVDPNRNYPAFWGVDEVGSSSYQYAETYRGTNPGSEPETQAVMAFHAAHPPVVSVSYHSYSGLVLYPWGFRAGELPPDLPRFQALAGTDLNPAVADSVPGSSLDHYHPGPGWNLYTTNGEYTDWAYHTHGTIAFTIELTSGCCVDGVYYGFEFPDDSAMVERVFRDNLPFARALIAASDDLARSPGVTGAVPVPEQFMSLWPDAWLSLDASAARPLLTLRTGTGVLVARGSLTDSLRRGTLRTVWRTDLHLDAVRALRADDTPIAAELLSLAGAEPLDAGWRGGWLHDTAHVAGPISLGTPGTETPPSPLGDLGGGPAGGPPCVAPAQGRRFS